MMLKARLVEQRVSWESAKSETRKQPIFWTAVQRDNHSAFRRKIPESPQNDSGILYFRALLFRRRILLLRGLQQVLLNLFDLLDLLGCKDGVYFFVALHLKILNLLDQSILPLLVLKLDRFRLLQLCRSQQRLILFVRTRRKLL